MRMPISRDDSHWAALARALAALAREIGAANAVVADVSENLWCRAVDVSESEMDALDQMFALAMSTASAPLQRGGHVNLVHDSAEPFVCAVSFAGIYLLLVWFKKPFGATLATAAIKKRLPEIERLTVSLPPDDPERPSESANRGRR
jgi:hypothetical protein